MYVVLLGSPIDCEGIHGLMASLMLSLPLSLSLCIHAKKRALRRTSPFPSHSSSSLSIW